MVGISQIRLLVIAQKLTGRIHLVICCDRLGMLSGFVIDPRKDAPMKMRITPM